MTDYRTLPDDVKQEIIFDALKFTKAAIALSHLTEDSPEVWGDRCSNQAYADLRPMSQPEIEAAIETIERVRTQGFGARMERIEISKLEQPKGLGMTIRVRLTIEAETVEAIQAIIALASKTIETIQPDANTRTKSSHGGEDDWYELVINPPDESSSDA